ncbi:Conserved_hypothetical protein [Hexamita inflata]|uniref:Uncharacterized protein n=1 Tax=Hexamita inflata TaxID=28002 RepID=A0AA86NZP5_9EUKA|nr:Conserved hypothetical protein [Hexamita inflata]
MQSCCARISLDDWFYAAKRGDYLAIQNNMYHARKRDRRPTDKLPGNYRGFAAIHYAVINDNLEIVKLLIEREYLLALQYDQPIQARAIGPDAVYMLRSRMTILHLSMLVGNFEMTKFIIQYQHRSRKSLSGVVDSHGQFASELLFLLSTSSFVLDLLILPQIQEELLFEFTGRKKLPGPMISAALFGRYQTVQFILENISQVPVQFKKRIFRLAQVKYKGKGVLECCQANSTVGQGDKDRTAQAFAQLLQIAEMKEEEVRQ